MARNSEEWLKLLRQYAQSFANTGVKPQDWYEKKFGSEGWNSAKRHISKKKAEALIESGEIKPRKSRNSAAKKTSKNAKNPAQKNAKTGKASTSKKTAVKNRTKVSDLKDKKPLNNKGEMHENDSEEDGRTPCEDATNTSKKIASPKQSHGAICQATVKNRKKSQKKPAENSYEIEPDLPDEIPLCGARNRLGNPCAKQAGWGTDHFGSGRCRLHGGLAGASTGNTNATIHGVYSQYLDDDEAELFLSAASKELDLTNEIGMTRVELKRCYERAAIQRKILGGAIGRYGMTSQKDEEADDKRLGIHRARMQSAMEVQSHDDGINVGAEVNLKKAVLVNYTDMATRLMTRLMSLIRQQNQLATAVPQQDAEDVIDHYLGEWESGAITAQNVASQLARFRIKTPDFILLAIRSELENTKPDSEGLTDEELDAMVKEERETQEAIFADNMEGRADIIARMERGEDIDLDALDA